ncbi:hypothetical protein GYH30_034805 [Glycine max]|uniref:KOW domain-containing protein n=2 Tax=Glycine subgen. Soja TaxID=1462606 RepID=K7LY80_SOYBN|nr:hypothetical protein GYH30_034805 [Glycine max]RZB70381.1 60S ribosomal protein L26-1 [Glycine soja]
MKFNPRVSLSRRKSHNVHFIVPSSVRRVLMSTSLSIDLRSKYNVRSISVRKDDEWVIHIEHITREKVNANVGIHPSKIDVTKLRMDKGSKSLLDRKAKGCATADKEKGTKFAPEDIMETVN